MTSPAVGVNRRGTVAIQRSKAVIPHLYRDDGTRDADDLGRCVHCGTFERNARHDTTVPDDVVEAEQRRTGDR